MLFQKKTMEELERLNSEEVKSSEKFPYAIVLDNIRSMNNVGSAFRTADAFHCKEIILVGITAQPPHRDIAKTALGAEETVSYRYFPEISLAVEYLLQENYQLVAVEQTHHSQSLEDFTLDLDQSYAFIFGNEVYGVSDDFLQRSEKVLEIPQFGSKHSLNIAVSIGVICWNFLSLLSQKKSIYKN